MNSVDRLLLFIIAIALGILGLTLLASMTGFLANVMDLFSYLEADYRAVTVVAAVAVVVASFYLLSLALRTRHSERSVVRETSLGNVKISLKTIESVVLRAARQVKGIRDVEATVQGIEQGLLVELNLSVAPDLNIPDAAAEVQRLVEESVQATIGMSISQVRINVRALAVEGKARVE